MSLWKPGSQAIYNKSKHEVDNWNCEKVIELWEKQGAVPKGRRVSGKGVQPMLQAYNLDRMIWIGPGNKANSGEKNKAKTVKRSMLCQDHTASLKRIKV